MQSFLQFQSANCSRAQRVASAYCPSYSHKLCNEKVSLRTTLRLLRSNAHVSSAQYAAIAKDRERATINAKGRSRASPAKVELEKEEIGKRNGGRKEGGEGEGEGGRGRGGAEGGEREVGCAPPGARILVRARASVMNEEERA